MIWIKNGRLIDPARGLDQPGDVILEDGKIAKVIWNGQKTDSLSIPEGGKVLDAAGLVVAPGLADVHVHFRDPGFTYKEDIGTGAAAAAKGGFTSVVLMANTKPVNDNVETFRYVIEKGKQTGIHVFSAAAVSKGFRGEELTDMEGLKAAGAVGFTDDGIPLKSGAFVRKAMAEAARLGMPLSFHEEDPAYIAQNGINHGTVSDRLGIYGSPALAEDAMVARDCMIALDTGAVIEIQHISSANSVAVVRLAKSLGAKVWAEVTPHHFALTEEAVLEHGSLAKMNPPLRTEKDRQALIQGLKDGTIDIIATDHAPHSREEKERPLTEAPSGIIGLETSLALGITHLVKPGHISLLGLMEKMSLNPGKLYQKDWGRLEEGCPADLVIFDENRQWEVREEEFASKASNSPFIGARLTGKVAYTICGGKIVYEDLS